MLSKDWLLVLASLFTGLGGFLAGRGKTKAQTDLIELQATEKAITIWRQLAQDLNAKVNELSKQVEQLHKENRELRRELNELRRNK